MQKERIALYPGSFDPITLGHEMMVRRALTLFDKVIVAIGVNSGKKLLFPLEKRLLWVKKVFEGDPRVEVHSFEGLSINFCKDIGASFLLRGLRSANDLEFEQSIAIANKKVGAVETIFMLSEPEYSHISSSIVRDLYLNGGDLTQFISNKIDLYEP